MSGNTSVVTDLGIAGRDKGDTAASKNETKTEAKTETKSSDAKVEVGGGGGGDEKKKNRVKQTDVMLNNKIDDFRASIKTLAHNQKKSVPDYLHGILDDFTTTGEDKVKVLSFDSFENGMSKVKGLTAKLFKADLRQIFDEIEDLSLKGTITVDKIVAFCQKNIPIVRTMALKLRQGITEKYTNEAGYRKLFDTLTENKSKFADLDMFLNAADDILDKQIDVSDGHDLYMLFDMDGDGQVSVDDFIGFLMGNTALEGMNALKSGNQDAIVDVKISVSPEQETELQRCGYHCVTPSVGGTAGRGLINGGAAISQGTFGRGQSMWIWRRSQGVCSGRLKPIVDMYLDSSSSSSALVLSGYTCVPVMVANQWLWLKRAANKEEEKDAILDVVVTLGRAKLASDAIWASPGVGYRRVDGNFAKAAIIYGGVDAFVWFKPARSRSDETNGSSPIRAVATMSEETRIATLLVAARKAVRHFVPLSQIQRLAKLQMDMDDAATAAAGAGQEGQPSRGANIQMSRSDRLYDFSALYLKYDPSHKGQLTRGKLQRMLQDVGARVDSQDMSRFFYFFNLNNHNINAYISREEFTMVMKLSEHEIDLVVEDVRNKLLPSAAGTPTIAQSLSVQGNANTFREGRLLSGVFQAINRNKHNKGVLSLDEVIAMAAKLEIFLTEDEAERIFALMDGGSLKDGKVTEADFIGFMKKRYDSVARKASRVRNYAAMFRRWLASGSVGLTSVTAYPNGQAPSNYFSMHSAKTMESTLEYHWQTLKRDYEKNSGQLFQGYLGPEHIMKAVAMMLNVRISMTEAQELALMIAPEKRGRIQKNDLSLFMTGSCRTFGELVTILERDVLKPLLDAFAKLRDAIRANSAAADGSKASVIPQLQESYDKLLKDMVSAVQGALAQAPNTQGQGLGTGADAKKGSGASEVVSVYQVKTGLEMAYRRRVPDNTLALPDNKCPTLEEWIALACLVGADVCVEDLYGIRVQKFLEGICIDVVGGLESVPVGAVSLDVICQDLKLMLTEEAKAAAVKAKKKGLDFDAVFKLFDENHLGYVDLNDFKHMLGRLQLITQLPENQIPALLARFDKDKKGKITRDDLIKFVGADKKTEDDLATFADDGEFDLDDDYVGQSSNKPPEAITKNADGDWLIWFLWREACKVEPTDPESVITELEAACAETLLTQDDSLLSLDELWAIICDLKLRGTLSKEQFGKHAGEIVKKDAPKGKGGGALYDFEALCRYTVRMGRAYNKIVQAKRIADNELYAKIKMTLQKNLSGMISTDSSESKGAGMPSAEAPRYEKVFRRLDSDGDGLLTMQEFKVALKKFQYEDEKKWTMRMIRRLFNEFDSNQDGLLSVREFSSFIQDFKVTGGAKSTGGIDQRAFKDKDDEEDDKVFGARTSGSADSEILRKVNEVLQDVILASITDPAALAGGHAVVVQREVRRYFQKHDPDATGTVTEERFRSFCRRSGLQDRLNVAELRRLVEKLRRRRPGKDKAASVVDYEKFLHLLTGATESIPHSRSEAVVQRLQEAAAGSAALGRPFLSLCSLVDHRLSGRISREDLLHTAKMMECILTNREIDALRELYPDAFSKDGQAVDYRELNEVLVSYTPRQGLASVFDNQQAGTGQLRHNPLRLPNGGLTGTANLNRSSGGLGALPTYVTQSTPWDGSGGVNRSSSTTVLPADVAHSMMLATPSGFPIATPFTRTAPKSGRRRDGGLEASNIQYVFEGIAERVSGAVAAQRTRGYSLMGHFEELDRSGRGFLSFRSFEAVLYEIGVDLENEEIEAVVALFGDGGASDFVDYAAFCSEVNDVVRRRQRVPRTAPRHSLHHRNSRDFDAALEPTYTDRWLARASSPGPRSSREQPALYDNLQRFRESVGAMRDQEYDDHEGGQAGQDNEDGYGFYAPKLSESFGSSIMRPTSAASRATSAGGGLGWSVRGSRNAPGFNNNPRFSRESLYEEDTRARSPLRYGRGRGMSGYPGEGDEEGFGSSRFDRSLSPIRSAHSPTRGGVRSSGGIPEPSMSPTKMGALMWGKDTPLVGKGKVPNRGPDTWCCAVCMYVENPHTMSVCQVCDSPNYTVRKDFQVKEQCRNCTFLNGQFARDCEMCGEPLSGGNIRQAQSGSSHSRY